MKVKKYKGHSMDNFIKSVIYNLVLVVITIIADKTLTPAFNPIFQKVLSYKIKLINRISHFIYSRIAEGVYINIAFYIFIFVCCEFTTTFIDIDWFKDLTFIDANILKAFGIILIYFFMLLFLMLTNFINKSITKMTCNIEILSAYVSNDTYKQLRSSFFSIENKKDYDELFDLMKTIALHNNVKLK